MELQQVTASEEFGFVDGIVDQPITEQERADGKVGHTADEWEAYSLSDGGATAHALRDEHQEVVGHLLRTYVDRHGRLCVAARLNMDRPGGKELFQRVKSGEKHSFSIGYDAIPQKNTRRYKNTGMDVSLTSEPRKEFATVQVRCNRTMSSQLEGDAAKQQETAAEPMEATPSPPSSKGAPPATDDAFEKLRSLSPDQLAKTSAEALLRERELSARLADAEEKAKKLTEYEERKKKKMFDKNWQKLTSAGEVMATFGFDPTSEAQKPVAEALAQSAHSSTLVSAMDGMSQENRELKRKLQEYEDAIKAAAQKQEEERNKHKRDTGLLEVLRQMHAGDQGNKRANRQPSAPVAAAGVAETANLLGLDKLQSSLFEQAKQNQVAVSVKNSMSAHAAAQSNMETGDAARGGASSSSDDADMVDMPTDPRGRLTLAYECTKYPGQQMTQVVRCSKGQPGFVRPDVERIVRSRPTAFGEVVMSDAQMQLMLGDGPHWQEKADKLPFNAWSRDGQGNLRDFSHLKKTELGPSSMWSIRM